MKFCIKYKSEEKIFTEATPKFLWALNLHNADSAYRSQLQYVLRRKRERKAWELSIIKRIKAMLTY